MITEHVRDVRDKIFQLIPKLSTRTVHKVCMEVWDEKNLRNYPTNDAKIQKLQDGWGYLKYTEDMLPELFSIYGGLVAAEIAAENTDADNAADAKGAVAEKIAAESSSHLLQKKAAEIREMSIAELKQIADCMGISKEDIDQAAATPGEQTITMVQMSPGGYPIETKTVISFAKNALHDLIIDKGFPCSNIFTKSYDEMEKNLLMRSPAELMEDVERLGGLTPKDLVELIVKKSTVAEGELFTEALKKTKDKKT